jgi:Sporulation and spore germination
MMLRWRMWLIGMLVLAVIIAAAYFPILKRRMRQSAQVPQQSEEQARRELTQQPVAIGGDLSRAKMFWSSGARDGSLMPVSVDLPLSKDPALRAKQVLNTLLAGPVDTDLRTLPSDAVLLAFYLLRDGTAIADFSEALATATPSGIESEQMAIDSITKTLEANIPQVHWLKILIHGQEVDTLAGHLDLTRTFLVNARAVSTTPSAVAESAPAGKPAPAGAGAKLSASSPAKPAASQKLTPATPPGKLAQPVRKP